MASTALRDTTGRVVNVRDTLDGIGTSLKHATYQLAVAGAGNEPHPWCWTESSGLARAVLQKEAELLEQVAGSIERWIKANPRADAANLAAMKAAAKEYRAVARSLLGNARKMRNAQSCLEVTNT
jgi:hypothetical protein